MLPEQDELRQFEQGGVEPSLYQSILDDPQLPNLEGVERADLLESVYQRLARDHPEFYGQTPDSEATFDLRKHQVNGQTHYLPAWWPSRSGTTMLSLPQRLIWFQRSVRSVLPIDPSHISNKRELQSQLLMALPILHTIQATGSLPTPDLL
jgi:hypothetical protein